MRRVIEHPSVPAHAVERHPDVKQWVASGQVVHPASCLTPTLVLGEVPGQQGLGMCGDPPAGLAHADRYAVIQSRGLIPHIASVWNSENRIAASRPLQTDPEP